MRVLSNWLQLALSACMCCVTLGAWSINYMSDKDFINEPYLEAYLPESKRWIILKYDGHFEMLERKHEINHYFESKKVFSEGGSTEKKSVFGMYKTSSNTYVIAATEGTRKILIIDIDSGLLVRTINPVGLTIDIYSLFHIPSTNFGISVSDQASGGIIKYDLAAGTAAPSALPIATWFGAYIEDNEIFFPTTTTLPGPPISTEYGAKIVDSTTMTVKTTLTGLETFTRLVLRYKKSYPTADQTLIIAGADGSITLRLLDNLSANEKRFPSDIERGLNQFMTGIDDTALIIVCVIHNTCFLGNPSAATSITGSPLPRLFEVTIPNSGGIVGGAFQNSEEPFFFILSFYKSRVYGVSLCGGDGCAKCTDDYEGCASCEKGIEVIAPVTLQRTCLAECPNRELERISYKVNKCINCITEYQLDRDACRYTHPFFLQLVSEDNSDDYSSTTVEISFEGSSEHLLKIPIHYPWDTVFHVDLGDTQYEKKWFVSEGKLLLAFNFTQTSEDDSILRVTNKKNLIYKNQVTGEALLIFIDSDTTLQIPILEPISASLINGVTDTSKTLSVGSEMAATATVLLATGGIFLKIPLIQPVMRFLLVFKILNRLRLVNISNGGVLSVFLSHIHNMFEFGNSNKATSGAKYETKTRGKISKYRIDVTPFVTIPHIYYFYLIGIVVEVVRQKIWKYAKRMENMSKADRKLVIILEKIRFFVFNSLALDLALYTFNSISHQDILVTQNSQSMQSFIICNAVGSMLVAEVIHMITLNSKFIFKEDMIAKKTQQAILQEDRRGSSAEIRYRSYYNYYKRGMNIDRINNSKVGRYFNLISLIRLIAYEPILVTLQMMPLAQIGFIFLVQLCMCIYTLMAAFKYKVFKNCLFKTQHLLFEFLLTVLLLVFFLMTWESRDKIERSNNWRIVQIGCIGLILIIALVNMMIMAYTVYDELRGFCKRKKDIKYDPQTGREYNLTNRVYDRNIYETKRKTNGRVALFQKKKQLMMVKRKKLSGGSDDSKFASPLLKPKTKSKRKGSKLSGHSKGSFGKHGSGSGSGEGDFDIDHPMMSANKKQQPFKMKVSKKKKESKTRTRRRERKARRSRNSQNEPEFYF